MQRNGAIALVVVLMLLVFGGLVFALVYMITNTPKRDRSRQPSGGTSGRARSGSQAQSSSS